MIHAGRSGMGHRDGHPCDASRGEGIHRRMELRSAGLHGLRVPWLTMLAFAGLILPRTAAAQSSGQGLRVDADASIRIVNLLGSTRVIGWDRDSVHVAGSPPEGGGTL